MIGWLLAAVVGGVVGTSTTLSIVVGANALHRSNRGGMTHSGHVQDGPGYTVAAGLPTAYGSFVFDRDVDQILVQLGD